MKSKICSLLREITMLYGKAKEVYEQEDQSKVLDLLCNAVKKITSLKKQLDLTGLKYSLHYTLPASKSIFNLIIYSKDRDARVDDCMFRLNDKYIFSTGSFFTGVEDIHLSDCYDALSHSYSHIVSDFVSVIDLFYVFSEKLKEFYYERIVQEVEIDGIDGEAGEVLKKQEELMHKLESRYNIEMVRELNGVLKVVVKVRDNGNFWQSLHVIRALMALDAYREVDVEIKGSVGMDKGAAIMFEITLKDYISPIELLEKVKESVELSDQ